MRRSFVCVACGEPELRAHQFRLRLCWPCNLQHRREAAQAMATVRQAIRKGLMSPASAHRCADCGGPAIHYDHRDYTQALQVSPVCAPCNAKRGRAFSSFYRPEPLAAEARA